jgi:DNA-binding MarR family transcriptional regulator
MVEGNCQAFSGMEAACMKMNKPSNAKEDLADGLHSAAIHLLRHVRKQDTKTGEGPARLSALSVLVFGGPMTLGQLAAAEQVRPPTMTRIVTGLERSGLAQRVQDAEDARRVKIHATAEGAGLLKRGRKLRVSYLARQLERLSSDEVATLEQGLCVLQKVLQQWEKV